MLIKICGLSTPHTARAALDAGADMIGLVFFGKSPRHVSPQQATRVAQAAAGKAGLVGLFVDPSDDEISAAVEAAPLSHLQLHGQESPERVTALRAAIGLPVIKAVGIATRQDVAEAEAAYGAVADMLLFDARPPKGAERPGGHGQAFDPDALADVSGDTPWLLAGGLTPDNVYDAVDAVCRLPGFAGVDVSSGVEAQRGIKDEGLIATFIGNARAAASDFMDMDA